MLLASMPETFYANDRQHRAVIVEARIALAIYARRCCHLALDAERRRL